ncbi:response regulator [Bombella sp. TMW 2.2559]|uniref:Response regulator n=1 Tax=Bombella dulcis TaxID=2967339 RepID=A0ABT3WHH8_9PROT|nr:response regulator [Bombella dulcis]MCX5616331.1 response regulator [Bombella dulcis]
MRILTADSDNVAIGHLIKVLGKSSYTVDHVKTADEALNMFKHYDYDLFITALGLSDLPGEELIRQFRRSRVSTPIMVLSSRTDCQTKVAAFFAGALMTMSPSHSTSARRRPASRP